MSTPSHTHRTANRAALLVGPTGSGKTPLGDLIEQRGLWRAKCRHFDFGANLRAIVERNRPDHVISQQDIDFLGQVLESGALLENEHFSIAERVLRSFLAKGRADARSVIVLNGLPRHLGQAEAVDAFLTVEAVIHLRCSPEIALQRIRANVGGDRTARQDDDLESIRNKLRLFAQRTAPLLDHYRASGAKIVAIDVTATMTPHDAWDALDRCP